MRAGDLGGRAVERELPGQQLEQQHAERVEVAAAVEPHAAQDLGRHVVGRPGGLAFDRAREPEVGQADLAALADQHVGGLQVAVQQPAGVDVFEPAQDRHGELDRALDRQRAGGRLGERALAGLVVGAVVERAVLADAEVDDRDQVRVPHRGERGELVAEAGGFAPARLLEHLDGDLASGAGQVAGEIHDGALTLSQAFHDLIAAMLHGVGSPFLWTRPNRLHTQIGFSTWVDIWASVETFAVARFSYTPPNPRGSATPRCVPDGLSASRNTTRRPERRTRPSPDVSLYSKA